jgi:hypothetical protein
MRTYILYFKTAGAIDIKIYSWMRSTSEGFSIVMKIENALGVVLVYIGNIKNTIKRR